MKTVIFVAILVPVCLGALFRETPNPIAGKGKCISQTYPELGELRYGETRTVPWKCISLSCDKEGITGASCGTVGVPPGCTLKAGDLNKDYPDCCSTEIEC